MTSSSAPGMPGETSIWAARWRLLSHSPIWVGGLLGLGSLSSVVYPHAPLAGFAIAAGTTLPLKKGAVVTTLIWLVNQAIGFGLRGYPPTVEAFTWGALMLLGSWVVLLLAALRPRFSQRSFWGHLAWVALSLGLGFGLYQFTILAGGWLMGSAHHLPWPVVAKLFSKDLVATVVLTGAYGLLGAQPRKRAA